MRSAMLATFAAIAVSAAPFAAFSASQSATTGASDDLRQWSYEPLYQGWSASALIDARVYGSGGEEIGEVHNLLIGPSGEITKVVVESGGFFDIGDTHFVVPWSEAKVGRGFERVDVPVTKGNVENYSAFSGERIAKGPREWRASELMGDYAYLEGGEGHGMVRDLIFDRDGKLQAVVVDPDVSYGVRGPYAYPFYGYDRYDWTPGDPNYRVPYTRDQVAGMQRFDFSKLDVDVIAAD